MPAFGEGSSSNLLGTAFPHVDLGPTSGKAFRLMRKDYLGMYLDFAKWDRSTP
jgi:hypothetical protein